MYSIQISKSQFEKFTEEEIKLYQQLKKISEANTMLTCSDYLKLRKKPSGYRETLSLSNRCLKVPFEKNKRGVKTFLVSDLDGIINNTSQYLSNTRKIELSIIEHEAINYYTVYNYFKKIRNTVLTYDEVVKISKDIKSDGFFTIGNNIKAYKLNVLEKLK